MAHELVPKGFKDFQTLGVVAIGNDISLVLLGIATVQVYYYYDTFRKDCFALKFAVGAIWLALLAAISNDAYSVLAFSTLRPDSQTRPKGYDSSLITSRVLEFLIQGVYGYRVYRFSGNMIVPLLSTILSVFAIACAIVIIVQAELTLSGAASNINIHNTWPYTSIYVIHAIVSLVISITMCYYLWVRKESGFKSTTRRQINRLVLFTLQTGLIPSVLSITGLIFYIVTPRTLLFSLLLMITPPLSANGLLVLLNDRRVLRSISEGDSIMELSVEFDRSHNVESSRHDEGRQGQSTTPRIKATAFLGSRSDPISEDSLPTSKS